MGELLIEMGKKGEREKRGGDRKSKSQSGILIPDLSDLGVSAKTPKELAGGYDPSMQVKQYVAVVASRFSKFMGVRDGRFSLLPVLAARSVGLRDGAPVSGA